MIVIICGYNGGGKSTYAQKYTDLGYHRVNRDTEGGTLDHQATIVAKLFKEKNVKNFVLDNTYVDIDSRKSIIACAKGLGMPIQCVWLNTSFEDAQFNACQRMIRLKGRLLDPIEFKGEKNPNLFPPVALFAYKKKFQKPTTSEGFESVEKVEFVRKKDSAYKNKALILDYDGTLRTSTGEYDYPIKPSEVKVLPGRKEKLNEYLKQGYLLLGASNQSGIAKGILSVQDAVNCFEETNDQLGHDIDYFFCPHSVPPMICYCRKPSTGTGNHFIEKYKLDASQCIMVGDLTSDKTFASRCGFKYYDQEAFFK